MEQSVIAVIEPLGITENQPEKLMTSPHSHFNFDLYGDSRRTLSPKVATALEKLSASEKTESLGSIFTRPEVVDFILDLVGYTKISRFIRSGYWNRPPVEGISCCRLREGF